MSRSADLVLTVSVQAVMKPARILTTFFLITALGLFLQTAAAAQCVDPPGDMIGWWSMDEPSGSGCYDISGNGNNGTLSISGVVPVDGKVGGALKFDGVTGFVEVPDSASLNIGASGGADSGDVSVDAWIKVSSTVSTSYIQDIVDKRTLEGSVTRGYSMYLWNGVFGFQLADGTYTNYSSKIYLVDGNWHHVAATVDRDSSSGGVLYIDGAEIVRFDPTARSGDLTNTSPMRIGSWPHTAGGFFPGIIDEVEVFDRALQQQEIWGIFNAGSAGKCKSGECSLACTAEASPVSGPAPLSVTFTGAASTDCPGAPSYSWDFDNDGTIDSRSAADSHIYTASGVYNWTFTATADGHTCTRTGEISVDCSEPLIYTAQKVTNPFRIKVKGSGFDQACDVYIGDTLWANRTVNSTGTRIVLRKGKALKNMFPKGVGVTITVVNPDECWASIVYP